MKKHPLILRCLIVLLALTLLPMFPVSEGNVLSFLSLGGTPAIAESLSVSVTLSGMNCNFTVNNAVSPTTWCQLLDSEGNILSSWDYSSTEGGMNFPINTPGEYRYYVIVIDSATGERASAYTPYFTFAECSHPTTIKTNIKEVYWEKDDYSHSIVLIYTPECTVCYKTLDPEEEIIRSGYHRFNNNGVCRDCDYCSHKEVSKEYTGESTVVNKNDYYYHYLETPYKVYCSYCNEHLKDGVESIEEVHYTFNGYCECGYYNCPHDNNEKRYLGTIYGLDGQYNDKQHCVEHYYGLFCFDCDKIYIGEFGYIPENPDLLEQYWEDHTFDSNGECIYCHVINPDYSPEAPVPPADLQVAVGMNTTAATKGDKLTATASVSGGSGKYACDWVITCNGAVVEMTAFDPGLTYVYYANQTGNWKFTAYVTDKENSNLKTVSASGPVVTVTECTHENTTTESIGNPSYEQLNDQQHTVVETVKDVCSNCGAVVKDEYTVTQPENHAFNKENKCTLCGYVVPDETCKHTKTKEVTQTTYNENGICDNDPDRHYRTVYKKRVCSDCKEVIENSETTNSKYENHNFDATGKCVCGYIKKTEETYEKLAVDIETWHNDAAFSESTKTISIGSTAKIVGGSGDYTCEWTATSNNGKSSKKTITTKDAKVSWAINVYEPDTWKFTITVTDNKTGKRASASSSITVISIVEPEAECTHNFSFGSYCVHCNALNEDAKDQTKAIYDREFIKDKNSALLQMETLVSLVKPSDFDMFDGVLKRILGYKYIGIFDDETADNLIKRLKARSNGVEEIYVEYEETLNQYDGNKKGKYRQDVSEAMIEMCAIAYSYDDDTGYYDKPALRSLGFDHSVYLTNPEVLVASKMNEKGEPVVVIAFRGTHNLGDLVTDAYAWTTQDDRHRGFDAAVKAFEEQIMDVKLKGIEGHPKFNEILARAWMKRDVHILVTGHSMGGAEAQLFIYDLLADGIPSESVVGYTYASPFPIEKQGLENDPEYEDDKAVQLDSNILENANIFNIVNPNDIVTTVGAEDGDEIAEKKLIIPTADSTYDKGQRIGIDIYLNVADIEDDGLFDFPDHDLTNVYREAVRNEDYTSNEFGGGGDSGSR